MKQALVMACLGLAALMSFGQSAWAGGSEKTCAGYANVLLKETASMSANNQMIYSCFCNVPANDYNQFMGWCTSQATAQDLNQLNSATKTSFCAIPANAAHCVR